MKVTITEMHSIRECIRALYMSKRTWSPEFEEYLQQLVSKSVDKYGMPVKDDDGRYESDEFKALTDKVFKYGQRHMTLLRFLDISAVVEGLHRGATDDFDSHAKRLENRIVRSSTRLATYDADEMSDWYRGKIIPTDVALGMLHIEIPDTITVDGQTYVKATNGYILKGLENDNDVKRGLYMLSLPMNFTFKVNIPELAHIYRLRGNRKYGAVGTAAPELQAMMEMLMDQVQEWYPQITREYLLRMEL